MTPGMSFHFSNPLIAFPVLLGAGVLVHFGFWAARSGNREAQASLNLRFLSGNPITISGGADPLEFCRIASSPMMAFLGGLPAAALVAVVFVTVREAIAGCFWPLVLLVPACSGLFAMLSRVPRHYLERHLRGSLANGKDVSTGT